MSLDISLYVEQEEVMGLNITHNLCKMAQQVKIGNHNLYEYLWNPHELKIYSAYKLIDPLKIGLARLHKDPFKYSEYNPDNGWGSYSNLLETVEQYLIGCIKYPEAEIGIWK